MPAEYQQRTYTNTAETEAITKSNFSVRSKSPRTPKNLQSQHATYSSVEYNQPSSRNAHY